MGISQQALLIKVAQRHKKGERYNLEKIAAYLGLPEAVLFSESPQEYFEFIVAAEGNGTSVKKSQSQ